MPKFYVDVTIRYEVEADDSDAALENYESCAGNLVHREVFDENMDQTDELWDEDGWDEDGGQ